ncbi:hypothetical protein WME82_27025 [Sorangium sp. So ce128]
MSARCAALPRPAEALLIRPDGYVAWAAAAGEPEASAHRRLRRALANWFGAACGSSAAA